MDPSAFIFVGLAIAWAAYLIPKALEHHDAGARSRTVDKFSHTMRVLARREPVDRDQTRLVTGGKPSRSAASSGTAAAEAPAPATERTSGGATTERDVEQTGFFAATIRTGLMPAVKGRRPPVSAARRRRRVLGFLLVLTALVGAVVAGRVISAWWIIAPVALLVGWLVACRIMVKGERAAARRPARRPATRVAPPMPAAEAPVAAGAPVDADRLSDDTAEVPAVRAEVAVAEPIASGDGWELVPVTLPTYVSKPTARRSVSAIDLDSTGVWTSGRTAADSALAQQADAVRAAAAAPAAQPRRRVSGA